MEIKFYTEKFFLDLSDVKFSTQEENSMMSDKVFTKFFFPFEVNIDDELYHTLGDYVSHESKDLETSIDGYLFHENKTFQAKLDIQNVEGNILTGQIDYGLEEIPNFDKKLSELPTEKFEVSDIYAFAEACVLKKWPQINYNFPRIFTKKYSSDSGLWDAFDGYYNDSTIENGVCKFKRNYINSSGNIFNVNIVHPCPHPIYLLKVGFRDAGYELLGDILTDPDLQDRWVFSGTEVFTKKSQISLSAVYTQMDFDSSEKTQLVIGNSAYTAYKRSYDKTIGALKPGNYKIMGSFTYKTNPGDTVRLKIYVNGSEVFSFEKYWSNSYVETISLEKTVPLNLSANNSIRFYAYFIPLDPDASDYNVMDFHLFSDVLVDENATDEDNGVVMNLNEINLAKAVPDMTFGDYVNTIKNWFNYDLEVSGTKIYMNRLGNSEPISINDFREFEVEKPKKTFLQKRSFLHKFSDLDDGYKMDSILYDIKGVKINGSKNKDTKEIEVNGYPLPVLKPKDNSVATAIVKKDSMDILALVFYDGLVNGQNNSKNVPGCAHPELFDKNWKSWLRRRIRGYQYEWEREVNAEKFGLVNIKDSQFCYNNIHLIVSMNKDKIGDNTYKVSIVTETIN